MSETIRYAQPIASADVITQLPSDKSQPTHNELQLVKTLFKEHGSTMSSIANEGKDSFLIGLLFIVFSLPMLDGLVIRIFPSAETSSYTLLGIKALVLMLTYWVIKHYYLAKKD